MKAPDPIGLEQVAQALRRAEQALRRRPSLGLHDDAPATARWEHGTRVASAHENGASVVTDMPEELGGAGTGVTPGWLFRAALASCLATRIAMDAGTAGIALAALEVVASSRSDARGLLGMNEPTGDAVPAGPRDLMLDVRIAAPGVPPERVRALVERGLRCSAIAELARVETPIALRVLVEDF